MVVIPSETTDLHFTCSVHLRLRLLLYGVAANDLSVFVLVAVILLAVGTLASAIPAWRASRADPLEALRAE